MRRAFLCLLVAAGGLLPRVAAAAEPARTHDITPDDYATLKTVTELAVSPDGKRVAYCLAAWDATADNRRTDLWVVATDGTGKPRQLTKDRANDRHPKWAADGKTLYALGNRKKDGQKEPPFDGSTQVWQVAADDGEVAAVTKVKGGVTGFDYAPKADAVFYAVDAEATDADDFTKLREQFGKAEYGHGKRKVSEVYRRTAGEGHEKLIAEKRYVRELAVAADGKRVAMISAPDDTVIRSEGDSRVDVWDEKTRKVTVTDQSWKKTAASPWPWLESLAWNPDGTRLAYCTIFDGHPAEVIVCEAKGGEWPARRVRRGPVHVRGYGSPLRWPNQQMLALVEDRGFTGAAVMTVGRGDVHEATTAFQLPPAVFYGYDAVQTESGLREILLAGTPSRIATLCRYTRNPDSPHQELLDHNPQAAAWKLPTTQHITWKAPDGATVGGPLELPYGFKKGDRKLPLVVAIHGGPTTASHAALEFDPHNGRLYFAAKGYAVLCPNYRGSTGYGDKFVTDLIGRENDIEVKDILAGIQHLVAEGIVDPDRVGVMGWSNGGYLTNCLISLKDSPIKFKAASSGAGIVDTVAEWGFNDEPAYPRVFKKGLPWETPEIYRKTSPTYQLGNVTTPTLIHVGGGDERCPPGHSRMLYRALKEYVKVPAELVVYPGEPHGLTKLSNRKAKMEWDLAWFDKYLIGK